MTFARQCTANSGFVASVVVFAEDRAFTQNHWTPNSSAEGLTPYGVMMFAIGSGYTPKVCLVVQSAEVEMSWNVEVRNCLGLATAAVGLDHVADRHLWLGIVSLSCLGSVFPGNGKCVGSLACWARRLTAPPAKPCARPWAQRARQTRATPRPPSGASPAPCPQSPPCAAGESRRLARAP